MIEFFWWNLVQISSKKFKWEVGKMTHQKIQWPNARIWQFFVWPTSLLNSLMWRLSGPTFIGKKSTIYPIKWAVPALVKRRVFLRETSGLLWYSFLLMCNLFFTLFCSSIFRDLDENLQKAFHKYLEIRGIKPSTTNFLHEYMINKDSREYLVWLKNLKKFVEA